MMSSILLGRLSFKMCSRLVGTELIALESIKLTMSSCSVHLFLKLPDPQLLLHFAGETKCFHVVTSMDVQSCNKQRLACI